METTIDTLAAKRQLVTDLKSMLDEKFDAADELEKRAIEMFKFSSTILGIVAGLGITISDIHGKTPITLGFGILLILFLAHTYCIYRIMKPGTYSIVPGIPRLAISYDEFYEAYISEGEEGYLNQMISDLAGTDDVSGAIEDAEVLNRQKAAYLQRLGLTFIAMIALLLAIAIFAIAG